MKKYFILTIIIFLALASCNKNVNEQNKWGKFVDNFIAEYLDMNPTSAVEAGLHEYDGTFGDLSASGIKKQIDWLYNKRAGVQNFEAKSLDNKQRFEREQLYAVIDKNLFWSETAQVPFKNPAFYLGKINPSVYLTREYAPLDVRMKAYIKYAGNLPAVLKQMKANLQLPLPKTFAVLGRNAFKGYVDFFKNDLPGIFSSVKNEKLQNDFKKTNKEAIKSVTGIGDWFEEILPESNGSYALGQENFKKMLWETERVNISLEELKKIGEADLERNLIALKKACEKIIPGKPIIECMDFVMSNKPEGGAVEGAREQLKSLNKLVKDRHIVSIPFEEEALVDEAPPYNRWNFAYIEFPGIYEKDLPAIYYIAPPDTAWSEDVQQKYIPGKTRLIFTSVHEVWPGHFLHSLHIKKSGSELSGIFWSYAFGEGWAHYTEEMMYDEGLGDFDPEYKVGQLTAALLRNIRFLSAIGLHTEGMTPEQSEKMFIEKGHINPGDSKQQAARGTFDPAYLNYTMGKLIIIKLRDDWLSANPDKSLKNFHDTFLSYGAAPIPLVRKEMMGIEKGSLF
ncbi:MAG: DUF885 domain-containing protein [Ignavibacteria bacterium]|nr:DUF885 domain-containing protein [Ignavibacteria bacterium]